MRRRGAGSVHGVLLVDKPEGPTSHEVCRRVQRALGAQKAGHTGTLDPMATGLLEICLGHATRLVPYLMAEHKTYRATLRLGAATDTLDREGAITAQDDPERVAAVGLPELEAASAAFLGTIEQRPPMYSALKVDGQRLHALARAGQTVEVPLRAVQIERLTWLGAQPPDFEWRVRCSKGTYVRSLGADLAQAVGLHGHLVALRREANGHHHVDEALGLEAIEANPSAALAQLRSAAQALSHLPQRVFDEACLAQLRQGKRPQAPADTPEGTLCALDAQGALVAIVEAREGALVVLRGMPQEGA